MASETVGHPKATVSGAKGTCSMVAPITDSAQADLGPQSTQV